MVTPFKVYPVFYRSNIWILGLNLTRDMGATSLACCAHSVLSCISLGLAFDLFSDPKGPT
jgi:hypothetical protein